MKYIKKISSLLMLVIALLAIVPSAAHANMTVKIDAGPEFVSGWSPSIGYNFSGGYATRSSSTMPVDTTRVTNPAPAAAYLNGYTGAKFSFVMHDLNPNNTYRIRLHFVEDTVSGAGRRVFDVAYNGVPRITNLDIFAETGGQKIALIKEFIAKPDDTSKFSVDFAAVNNWPIVAAIEVSLESTDQPRPTKLDLDNLPVSTPAQQLRAINAGGYETGLSPWTSDRSFSGGAKGYGTSNVATTNVTGAAPRAVYESERYGNNFTYVYNGLVPGRSYRLRLHFNEFYYWARGQRVFNVSANDQPILQNLDIIAAVGKHTALIRESTLQADASGAITVHFQSLVGGAKVSALELWSTATSGATIFTPDRNIRIMAVGDSITKGVGDYTWKGYRVPLWNRLAANDLKFTPVGWNIASPSSILYDISPYLPSPFSGEGGWSMNDLMGNGKNNNNSANTIGAWMQAYQPDVVLLHTGANDIVAQWDTPAIMQQDFTRLMTMMTTARPSTKLFVASPISFRSPNATMTAFQQFVREEVARRQAAGQLVYLVDMAALLPDATYYNDGVHPNSKGYALMAYSWYEALMRANRY